MAIWVKRTYDYYQNTTNNTNWSPETTGIYTEVGSITGLNFIYF